MTPTATKGHSEYWEAQVLTVRILQNSGLKVGVRDRLPLFHLWLLINRRMTGARKTNLLQLIDAMVKMRINGMEPEHNNKMYT